MESAIFIFFVVFLLPKDITIQNLVIFTAAGVVPSGGHEKSPLHPDPLGSLSSFRVILKIVWFKLVLNGILHISLLVWNRLN